MPRALTIGPLAKAAGCTVPTIRYYEQIGLLPRPARTHGNQRVYDGDDARRLAFIRHARELGFPLRAVRDLLTLADRPEQACDRADAIARQQLAAVKRRIARLEALKRELERMTVACRGGRIDACRVIEALRRHALCHAAHHDRAEPRAAPEQAARALS